MRPNRVLFDQLNKLATEQVNPRSRRLEFLGVEGILRTISREDVGVPSAVRREIPYIARAVRLVVRALRSGGRLIYIGAGTSGRLGVLDAAECPPTFGTPPSMVQGIMAGGKSAVFRSKEGSEDRESGGRSDIRRKKVGRKDVVCGIAASMRTPYVLGAIREARRRGAATVLVSTNPRSMLARPEFSKLRRSLDVAICPEVGPEVIMGSTRMKAGTAQKLVLNMMTTASMIRLGKVHGNLMVDLRMNSRKLRERAKRVLMMTTGVDYDTADAKLKEANGHVKTAIVMIKSDVSAQEARGRLDRSKGFVRPALRRSRS